MEIFSWKVEYNLGIDVIDSQHQQIVDYINELSYAINRGDNDEVYEVLEKLKDYCLDHFDFEEQLMQQAGYILLEAHQGVHRRFKERVDNIQEELLQGKDPMSVARRVRTWLMTWLIKHIQHEDIDYVPYVKKILKKEESWIKSALTRVFGSKATHNSPYHTTHKSL